MGTDDLVDILLVTLPSGARVVSTLRKADVPLSHVYRVLSSAGTPLQECATLIELKHFLDTTAPRWDSNQQNPLHRT